MKSVVVLTDGWSVHELKTNGQLNETEIAAWAEGDSSCWTTPLTARMPMQAHDALLANQKIDDLFIPGNCEKAQWIGERDWIYRTTFPKPDSNGRTFLHFHGLDTFVHIYLNGNHIHFHDNCYLPARLDVTDHLREDNSLVLHFLAAIPHMESQHGATELQEHRGAFIRKARKPAEDFGFFNGAKPAFIAIGVYDKITLETVDRAEFSNLDIHTALNDARDIGRILVNADVDGADGCMLNCSVKNEGGELVASVNEPVEGDNVAASLELKDPALWYPLGYGEHPVYTLETTLTQNGDLLDQATRTIGFRTVTMDGPFDFTVNGLKVKLWGANLTPMPCPGHIWDRDACTRLFEWAENANMTSIRAWGPGQPYDEQIFEEADRRGILMWAEFAHTGGPFPGDDEFCETCCREAEYWIRSWKHHPSLLFWCGGNETYLGFELDTPGQKRGDVKLFEEDYAELCKRLDPDRYYHINSPYGGDHYDNCALEGDTHVRNYEWFLPGHDYPILPSENTRVTVPLRATLEKHFGPDLAWPDGFTGAVTGPEDSALPPSWLALSPSRHWMNARIGSVECFYDADGTPDSFLFRMGAGTSRFVRETMERLRRGKPICDKDGERRTMGHYWWKYNDTWPMIYASLVDDQLQPNMSYYAMRRALTPLLLSIEFNDSAHVWITNDTGQDVEGTLTVSELDQKGLQAWHSVSCDVQVAQGKTALATNCDDFGMFYNKNPILAELRDADGNLLARTIDYATPDRRNDFPPARIKAKLEGDELILRTDLLARWVEIQGDGLGWNFDDNYFDLLPNEEKRIRFIGSKRSGHVTIRPHYSPHKTTIEIK